MQFLSGIFVKRKFIWNDAWCHIGNPGFRQKTFEIEQIDGFVGEYLLGGAKGVFIQIKPRFGCPLAPSLGGINTLKYDIGNIQFSGDRRAQQIRCFIVAMIGKPQIRRNV